jgi:beta-galactosidase
MSSNILKLLVIVLVASGTTTSAASTPLPAFLPEPYALPDVPQPLPYEALRVDLGQGQVLVPAQVMPRRSLDGQWRCSGLTTSPQRFAESEQLDRGWQNTDFDDQQWDTIAVPLDWYRAYPKARSAQKPFVIGWYRRSFELGSEAEGKRAVLHFGVAGYEADLWVNGHLAGSHHGDFTPWDIEIGEWTVPGKNILALRIRSDFGPNHGAGPARHAYGSQWSIGNIKGGLWQSCRLTLDSPLRITQLAIAPQWEQKSLRLDWQLSNQLPSDVQVDMRAIIQPARLGHESEPPIVAGIGSRLVKQGASDDHATIAVPGLRPWSPDRPELYWLTILIEQDGKVIVSRSERFGFRNFVARDGKFWLNGEPCYLFGENLAAIKYGGQGETPEAYAERVDHDLQGLKRNGYNIFRNAHMPIEPLVLERADEIGLMMYNK